jgi:ribonuclease P protein component
LETQEGSGNAAELRIKGAFRFERKERLKRRKDIQAVFSRGKRFGCRGAKLFVLQNNLTFNRICFTFSRGFGNAVERNRARRLGREAYRLLRPRLPGGYDLILLVFPETAAHDTAGAPSLAVRSRQLEFLFSKAGLWNDRNTKQPE